VSCIISETHLEGMVVGHSKPERLYYQSWVTPGSPSWLYAAQGIVLLCTSELYIPGHFGSSFEGLSFALLSPCALAQLRACFHAILL